MTASRVAVLDVIGSMEGRPDAEAGLLRSIEPAGHPARYETRVGDNRHHLVCRSCGLMRDVDCGGDGAPYLTSLVFWGLFSDCALTTPNPRGTA